jgi:hypothetical protein
MAKDRIRLRVVKGALVPADKSAHEQLRSRKFSTGDILSADLTKPRNPRFNRLVHNIGNLCMMNIPDFEGMGAHEIIKKIQLDGCIACEQKIIELPKIGRCMVTTPKSLAFDVMDEGEFQLVSSAIFSYISRVYWPQLTPEGLEALTHGFMSAGV